MTKAVAGSKEQGRCTFCQHPGHEVSNCRKLHPPQKKIKPATSTNKDSQCKKWFEKQKELEGLARLAPGFSGAKQRGKRIEFSTASKVLIHKVHQRFNQDIQLLLSDEPRYQTTRKKNMLDSNVLQRQMKKGVVTRHDFSNQGALWGYMKHKFTKRALLVFEAFHSILRPPPCTLCNHIANSSASSSADPVLVRNQLLKKCSSSSKAFHVASIGGGPGNDLYGFVLFKELCLDGIDTDTDTEAATELLTELSVFDFVEDAWSPLVDKVSNVIGYPINCLPCNVKAPLCREENVELLNRCRNVDIYLFSFVLHECRKEWHAFLSELWEHAQVNCIFYFKEPSDWIINRIIEHFGWILHVDYWVVLGDGIVVIKK
jgi:hypothetical protein